MLTVVTAYLSPQHVAFFGCSCLSTDENILCRLPARPEEEDGMEGQARGQVVRIPPHAPLALTGSQQRKKAKKMLEKRDLTYLGPIPPLPQSSEVG